MAQFRFVRLFYFVQALARFATYPSWDVSRTVYLLPTDQQSNQPVHSDNGEVPYHLMTFNDCPQDASLRLTRTAASTKQPVSPQAITRLGASHRFSGHGKITCDTMAQFRFVPLFYFVQALARFATYPSWDVSRTVYLLPTDQQSNQPVHSDSGEVPYHLMTFNDCPQDASLRLTRTAASTKQPVSPQAITRLGASHRFSGHGKITCDTMAQFRFVRLFYFVQALARFATYPSWDVSRTVYLLPTDQQSNQPVHSDSGEVPYHLMTFNDCPQDASLRLTRTAASTKQPVSPQAITRLGASHRFSGHGKITCDTMAQFRFVRLFYFVQALARFATYPSWDVSRTVYLLPTDQQSNQPVHSDSGEVPYHLMTFNDCPQDASLRLTRTAASTKQPVSPQAITRLGASHRFSGHGKITCDTMAQFRFVRLFYFVQALARFATYPSWDVSRTVYLLPTDQQSNQPVHSDSGEVPYHLMTFNDCPQDASLRLTRTAASTKQPVSPQAISRLGASHRFSGHGKITCDT
ncbi:hypothetical protein MTO96_046733 [Rhipicephalus appendiculatus]